MDADVDQALIPPFIFAHDGSHEGYDTWQLMMSEEGFQAMVTGTNRITPNFQPNFFLHKMTRDQVIHHV